MDNDAKTKNVVTYPLRLPKSSRQKAQRAAEAAGLSLNQFITLAVAEKITRMETAENRMETLNIGVPDKD